MEPLPLEIITWSWHPRPSEGTVVIYNDRDEEYHVQLKYLDVSHIEYSRGYARGSLFWKITDKLRRFVKFIDHRGIQFDIPLEELQHHSGQLRVPVPPLFPSILIKEKEMNNEDNDIPLSEREPEITTHYLIDGMSQYFTEQGVIDTVADLLASGVAQIRIRRVIRDKATSQTIQHGNN